MAIPSHLLAPATERQVRSAMTAAVRANLVPLATAMAIVFLVLAVASFTLGFGELAPLLAAIEICSAILALGIRQLVRRASLPEKYVYPLLFALSMIGLVRCLGQLIVWHSPRDTMNLALLVGATSLVSLSLSWSAAVVGLSWLGWWAVMYSQPPDSEWVHYGFVLFWATALGAAVQIGRQRLVRQLTQAEARYQMLIEHLPVVSYVDNLRPDSGPLYVSPQLEKILGFTPEEWVGSHEFWKSHLYSLDRERTLAAMRQHIADASNWDLEYRMVAKDGRIVWIHDRTTFVGGDSGHDRLSFGIMIDATYRKRSEALSSGGNQVLAQIAAGAPLDEVLNVLAQAAEEIETDTSCLVMLLDNNGKDLRLAASGSLATGVLAAIDGCVVSAVSNPCSAAVHANEVVMIEDIAHDARWPEARDAALQAGYESCWAEPIRSSAGTVLGALAMYYRQPRNSRPFDRPLIDVAARLAAVAIERVRAEAHLARHREHLEQLVADRTRELKTSLEQLRHSERLASVGTLAAGIAHEINNPVGIILLLAEQALMNESRGVPNTQTAQCLHEIASNARRCGRIIKNVLRFARQEPGDRWPSDINVILRFALEFSQIYLERWGAQVESRLSPRLPQVLVNAVELEQVFVNLICNGVESAVEVPQLLVTSEVEDGVVRIAVCDNGRGIPQADRSRVFDPFYTTRQSEGGTGLGLSVAYRIVTDHGGTIRVEDAPRGGTRMLVELPALDEKATEPRPALSGLHADHRHTSRT